MIDRSCAVCNLQSPDTADNSYEISARGKPHYCCCWQHTREWLHAKRKEPNAPKRYVVQIAIGGCGDEGN